MELTPQQVQLIRRSWRSFLGVNPSLVADIFYSKLFTDHPRLRKMFPDNMEQQYVKLMDMLTAIITRLDRIGEIDEELATMAQRHLAYGIKPAHYQLVRDALLWTLEHGLGKSWSPELKQAWTDCYNLLAAKMQMAPEERTH